MKREIINRIIDGVEEMEILREVKSAPLIRQAFCSKAYFKWPIYNDIRGSGIDFP